MKNVGKFSPLHVHSHRNNKTNKYLILQESWNLLLFYTLEFDSSFSSGFFLKSIDFDENFMSDSQKREDLD